MIRKKALHKLSIGLLIVIGIWCNNSRTAPELTVAEPLPSNSVGVIGRDGRARERPIAAIAAGDEREALLQHHLRYMAQQPGPPLIANNNAKLLIDGPQTYDAIFSSIATAKQTIDIEIYIFDDDRIGHAMAELIKKKQDEGVRVRLIYDSVGCIKTPRDFFDDLRASGIAVMEFNPVNPLDGKILSANNRDHRKIIIVDNQIAYTGGINISGVYSHGSSVVRSVSRRSIEKANAGNRNVDEEKALNDGWRDTQVQVRGPAAGALEDLFEATWQRGRSSNADMQQSNTVALIKPQGDKYIRIIGSSPNDSINYIYSDLFNAIENAQRSVHITMSYFSPNTKMINALERAAERGVDVQIVLPGFSDWWPVLEAGRSRYTELLDAGVRIYERRDVFLHAKTAVIDGVWSTVGSSNMDMRSFLHNNEVNAVVLGSDFGQSMETMFAADRAHAEKVDKETWKQRSLAIRIKQSIAPLFSYWL